ncbi:MAG: hypothetical protein DRG78_19380, partial [Epsilonproteobacteria bacterium]
MKRWMGIRTRLYIGGFLFISAIVLGLTMLSYQQYYDSQIKKIEIHSKAIISPFYELIRQELPDNSDHMDLYLKVALQAKESSQLPFLLQTHQNLEGICFFDKNKTVLLCRGKVNDSSLQDKVLYISNNQIEVRVPFEMNDKKYATALLAFSSKDFEKEKLQILINGVLFFIIFITLGSFGIFIIARSITQPIERLAQHIELNELENIPLLSRQDEIGDFSRTINNLAVNLKQRESELEYKAYFDTLTKLPNRNLFLEQLNQKMALAKHESKSISLLFIDLNNFKFVNDTYGHDIGDLFLIEVARRIQKSVKKSDLLARISGDEFNIVLYDFGEHKSISKYCENIFKLFNKPIQVTQKNIYISLSIGISDYPSDGEDAETLINKSDRAMYHAKDLGGNQYQFYNEELHVNNIDRLTLEVDLRDAIANNKIELNYQPKILLSNGKLNGMEALARWKHPKLG